MGLFRRLKSSKKKRIVARRRLLFEPLETRNLMALDLAAIGGTAFVDLTGNGLTGDDTRINGATVELYRDNGDSTFSSATDTLLGTTTTNASGVYRFASTNAGGLLPANTLTADNYFVRQLPVAGFSPPAAALVAITAANINGTTVQTVDTFDTTRAGGDRQSRTTTASSCVAATEAIGGERDVLVTWTSGDGDVAVQDRSSSTRTCSPFESGVNAVGTALIQYDGPDGNANLLARHRAGWRQPLRWRRERRPAAGHSWRSGGCYGRIAGVHQCHRLLDHHDQHPRSQLRQKTSSSRSPTLWWVVELVPHSRPSARSNC